MGARPGWNGVSREDKRRAETLPQRMSQKNVKVAAGAQERLWSVIVSLASVVAWTGK